MNFIRPCVQLPDLYKGADDLAQINVAECIPLIASRFGREIAYDVFCRIRIGAYRNDAERVSIYSFGFDVIPDSCVAFKYTNRDFRDSSSKTTVAHGLRDALDYLHQIWMCGCVCADALGRMYEPVCDIEETEVLHGEETDGRDEGATYPALRSSPDGTR